MIAPSRVNAPVQPRRAVAAPAAANPSDALLRLTSLLMLALAALALVLMPASRADEARFALGGDQYVAGQSAAIGEDVSHDAFAVGFDASVSAPVAKDAHLAGFNVSVSSNVTGDIYAAGFAVNITGSTGGDVTAAGNSVALRNATGIAGNARLAGATVTIAAPVAGAALVSAQTLTLDASIAGDLSFFGEKISFGPGARVAGKLDIRAPGPIDVPASVAAPERVSYQKLEPPDYVSEAGRTAEGIAKGFWPVLWAALTWWLLLLLAGVGFIALAPRLVERLDMLSRQRPLRRLGLGLLSLATVLGLVPMAVVTLIGVFLVPFVLIFVVVWLSLGYVAGAYLVATRLLSAFAQIDSNAKRVGVLALGLVVAPLLGMVPVLGWLITLLFLVFGLGVVSAAILGNGTSGAEPAAITSGPVSTPAASR